MPAAILYHVPQSFGPDALSVLHSRQAEPHARITTMIPLVATNWTTRRIIKGWQS